MRVSHGATLARARETNFGERVGRKQRLRARARFRFDDLLDCVTAPSTPGAGTARSRDGAGGTRSRTDDVTNDSIVDGVAVADDHFGGAFKGQYSQLKVTFNIGFSTDPGSGPPGSTEVLGIHWPNRMLPGGGQIGEG